MAINLRRYRVPVAFIFQQPPEDKSEGFNILRSRSLGTAFAMNGTDLLTAHHNIFRNGKIRARLAVGFENTKIAAVEYLGGDPELDVAVVRMVSASLSPDHYDKIMPAGRPPIINEEWIAPGYPYRYSVKRMLSIGGTVRMIDAQGFATIQLYCYEASAGQKVKGYSGAPVLVDEPMGFEDVAAVGVIVKGAPTLDAPECVDAVFATLLEPDIEPDEPDDVDNIMDVYSDVSSRPEYENLFSEEARVRVECKLIMKMIGAAQQTWPSRENRRRKIKDRRRNNAYRTAVPGPRNRQLMERFIRLIDAQQDGS